VGDSAIVGACSVVTKSVESGMTVVGNPARTVAGGNHVSEPAAMP